MHAWITVGVALTTQTQTVQPYKYVNVLGTVVSVGLTPLPVVVLFDQWLDVVQCAVSDHVMIM